MGKEGYYMTVSEAQKAANAKWDKEHMTTIGCRVKKEDAAAFKKYAVERHKTANTVLKEYVMTCIGKE